MRATLATLAVLALSGLIGCSDEPNVQYLPIGSRCTEAEQCGTRPYGCDLVATGGYCQKSCAVDGDCPMDAVCAVGQCRRKCQDAAECRTSEGYGCRAAGGTTPTCEPGG